MDTQRKSLINFQSLNLEPFTQRSFCEIIKESSEKKLPHVLAKVFLKEETLPVVYDARLLCKYLFELVISKEGRKVRLKRVSDPINDKVIRDILFYEVPVNSKDGLDGEYIGSQKDFLESSGFRSKIFNRNDPFDSLSINFLFKDTKASKLGRRHVVLVAVSFIVLCAILLSCTYTVIHNDTLVEPIEKYFK